MSQYKELDRRILKAVAQHTSPLHSKPCSDESKRIADATGREDFRVLDGRLQAIRKSGKIRHLTKAESNGQGGWALAQA